MRRHHYLTAFSCGLLTALLWGCNDGDKGTLDDDGDGFDIDEDCDDSDASVNPMAPEICGDGIDNDCNGGDAPCLVDGDGDGYLSDVDCDDTDDETYPGAPIDCSGGDSNCDGIITQCEWPSLIYEPTSPADYDSYDAAVFGGYVVFGDPSYGGPGAIGDGQALFFEPDAGTVDEFAALMTSDGAVGETGAYGTVVEPRGDMLCISADYQDNGTANDAGKTWCFSEATVQAASGSLALASASFTTAGEDANTYSKFDGEVDVDGDGNLDMLVYTAQGMQVILGTGAPWTGDYLVPSGADLSLGNCGSSTSGWCGFGRTLTGATPPMLALTEEGGSPDTISLYTLPLVGGSTVPTGTVSVNRTNQSSGTGVALIDGAAFGDYGNNEVTFIDDTGAIAGSVSGSNWYGYWSSTFIDARGHELLLVSAPYQSDPSGDTGLGVVYVYDLTTHGLPSSSDEAAYVLVPPEGYDECGWRARGGVVYDGANRDWTVVAISCPATGGAAYMINSELSPPPPVMSNDIYPVEPGQYNIRQWVIDEYTSELEWMMSLAQTEAVFTPSGDYFGWRLHAVAPGSPLYRAGLRNDDVLRKVNGIDVTSPKVVNQLFAALQNAQGVNVGVIRNGNPRLFQYSFVP